MVTIISRYGLVGAVRGLRPAIDAPQVAVNIGDMGNLKYLRDQFRNQSPKLKGVGSGTTSVEARTPAIAEAYERYSATVIDKTKFIVETAEALGDEALDLGSIPTLGSIEMSDVKCPLRQPTARQPIRWVKGMSLTSGKERYVPVVMAYLSAGYMNEAERFVSPISTGCAAHKDYDLAVLAGLMEVIERDALSLLWLQRLAFPKISLGSLDLTTPLWELTSRGSRDLELHLWDATTDAGVPTVYGLQVAKNSIAMRNVVGCAAGMSIQDAASKVLRDITAARIGNRRIRTIPSDVRAFDMVYHGSIYMGHADRADAYKFLFEDGDRLVKFPNEAVVKPGMSAREALIRVSIRIEQLGFEIYVVDLTADEAYRAGLRVVRVLVPGLQPLPYVYRARCLGNPRLYQFPRKVGVKPLSEREINPYPNPFA